MLSAVTSIVPWSSTALSILTSDPAQASWLPSTSFSVGLMLWLMSKALTVT